MASASDGAPSAATTPAGTHNLLIAEVVNAHLRGRRLKEYQVVGELRALPTSVPCQASEFRFRLKNTHRIEQLKVNEKLVTPSANGEYTVKLQPMSVSKPVQLVKYVANHPCF